MVGGTTDAAAPFLKGEVEPCSQVSSSDISWVELYSEVRTVALATAGSRVTGGRSEVPHPLRIRCRDTRHKSDC